MRGFVEVGTKDTVPSEPQEGAPLCMRISPGSPHKKEIPTEPS